MADGAKELIGDIVAGIVGNLPLKDVLRCSQVCRAWRDACKDRRTWSKLTEEAWGQVHTLPSRTLPLSLDLKPAPPWHQFATLAHCHNTLSWVGWCEDLFTCPGGLPYAMQLLMADPVRSPSSTASYTRHGVCTWTYSTPHPRTRVHVTITPPSALQPPGATTCPLHDVLQPHTAQPALPPAQCSACSPSSSRGLGVPLHMGAVKLYEHSRLPGSGQVDTPNSYSGFRVGPVLLGCFMLPRVPLHMLRLASRRQAMGTWVLWDPRLLLTPADLDCILSTAPKPPATSPTWPAAPNTLPTAAAKAAPSSPSATTAAKPSSSSPSTAAAEPSTAAAAAAGMGTQAGIPVHAAAGAVSGPHLGKDVPAGCLAAAGLRVAAWVGLRPGALLQGTCVTNFQTLDISTHQRLGSAMLGHVQVRVLAVTASPQASPGSLFAPHNPLAEATLQLDLAARCHSISPFSPDVVHTAAEDDSAYTPAATLTARVVLMPDGTLHPAPAAADSGRPTSTGTEHLTTRPMLHARAPAHLALTLSERLQAEGRVVPQPQLVDQWPVDMHGLASGGVLCGMLLHPVIGRATFCASIHGAAALCPLR